MNHVVTSKEAILEKSRELVMEQGISAINMRAVAKACGVSVGSVYNYFPSKTQLIQAAIEEVWKDIFHMSGEPFAFGDFKECLVWLFKSIENGCRKYPGFFTLHSVSLAASDKAQGRQRMELYFDHIKESLVHVLEHDTKVRPGAFDENFTAEEFVELIFHVFTLMLLKKQQDYKPVLEMVTRCIY